MNQSTTNSSPTFACYLSDKREDLTEILRSRLIECGWRDQVANMCRNLIQKHGVEQIRLEEIIGEVRQKARQRVPEQVKAELLDMIRKLDQAQLQPQKQPPQQTKEVEEQQELQEKEQLIHDIVQKEEEEVEAEQHLQLLNPQQSTDMSHNNSTL